VRPGGPGRTISDGRYCDCRKQSPAVPGSARSCEAIRAMKRRWRADGDGAEQKFASGLYGPSIGRPRTSTSAGI